MKHGGDITQAIARFGGAREAWLDLSTGINPRAWPMPHNLPDAIWQHLPDRADEAALLDAARVAYRLPDDVAVVAAPGTQALIQWLPRLAADGPVAILTPTYSEHALSWHNGGHDVIPLGTLDNVPDDARHVVLVNPNNPNGHIVDHTALARVAAIVDARSGWLVVDEAFVDVMPEASAVDLCAQYPVVILRSFGKFYGLAGLRLGFALAVPTIAARIADAIGPWACSGPALVVGAQALRDHRWADATRDWLKQQSQALGQILHDADLQPIGGTPLYRLVRHRDASIIHARLAAQQIWCRSFDWDDSLLRFGLPPDRAALQRLKDALAHR